MGEPPHDPDTAPGKPKYLPRLVYRPPPPPPVEGAEEPGDGPPPPPGPEPRRRTPPSGPREERAAPRPKETPRGATKPGGLVEPTPDLDTHDARRRIRLTVGLLATGLILLSGVLIVRTLRPDPPIDAEDSGLGQEGSPDPRPRPRPQSPAVREAQAAQMLVDAKAHERAGRLDLARERVERVLRDYRDVPSARLASEARQRQAQGLPLFVDGAAVIATTKEPEPGAEAEASAPPGPAPEAPTVAASGDPAGVVTLEVVPPHAHGAAPALAAPAEPRRATGLGLPRAEVAARPLPEGFRARTEAGVHESGWPLEITGDRDGASMVLVPGGIFTQGRDDGPSEERPAHKVDLGPYYIDQHEVTARQFRRFRPDYPATDDEPAVGVALAEARSYAHWAGKSIPTEAQWEKAARTPDGRVHPWGNAPARWERSRAPKQIDPVMSFGGDLSPYGAFDLAGNAWEWTNDWFDPRAYDARKNRVVAHPTGPPRGKGRLPEVTIKGGSKDWSTSWRAGMRPDARLPYLGFRGVLNVEAGAPAADPPPGMPPARRPVGPVPF